jgi:hypothetical protein
MHKEIRGLLAGKYVQDDGDCILDISKMDDGTHVYHVDFEHDICYHWIIDENRKVVSFNISSPFEVMK